MLTRIPFQQNSFPSLWHPASWHLHENYIRQQSTWPFGPKVNTYRPTWIWWFSCWWKLYKNVAPARLMSLLDSFLCGLLLFHQPASYEGGGRSWNYLTGGTSGRSGFGVFIRTFWYVSVARVQWNTTTCMIVGNTQTSDLLPHVEHFISYNDTWDEIPRLATRVLYYIQ